MPSLCGDVSIKSNLSGIRQAGAEAENGGAEKIPAVLVFLQDVLLLHNVT